MFKVARQAPITSEPAKRALHDPAMRQDLKACPIVGASDDALLAWQHPGLAQRGQTVQFQLPGRTRAAPRSDPDGHPPVAARRAGGDAPDQGEQLEVKTVVKVESQIQSPDFSETVLFLSRDCPRRTWSAGQSCS